MNKKHTPLLILALLLVSTQSSAFFFSDNNSSKKTSYHGAKLKDDISTLKTQAERVEKELKKLEERLLEEVDTLEGKRAGRLQDIEAKIEQKKERLKSLEGQIDALEGVDQLEVGIVEEAE